MDGRTVGWFVFFVAVPNFQTVSSGEKRAKNRNWRGGNAAAAAAVAAAAALNSLMPGNSRGGRGFNEYFFQSEMDV